MDFFGCIYLYNNYTYYCNLYNIGIVLFCSTGNGWLGTPFPIMGGWELEVPTNFVTQLRGYAFVIV